MCLSIYVYISIHNYNTYIVTYKNSSNSVILYSKTKTQSDISLSDTPKALTWSGEFICVGMKREYQLVNVS